MVLCITCTAIHLIFVFSNPGIERIPLDLVLNVLLLQKVFDPLMFKNLTKAFQLVRSYCILPNQLSKQCSCDDPHYPVAHTKQNNSSIYAITDKVECRCAVASRVHKPEPYTDKDKNVCDCMSTRCTALTHIDAQLTT